MSQGYAQEIITQGAVLRASLWADDGGGSRDHFLADLTVVPGWPVAGTDGLGAELFANGVPRSTLNEDAHDADEIYAKVSYFDYRGGRTQIFRTGTVHGEFTWLPPGSGNPQCLLLC